MHTHLTNDEASVLRHACGSCGGSCQGVIVAMLNQPEAERVRQLGAKLGVEDPIEDGRLRLTDGHCVFLGEDKRCQIHATYGLEAKPTVCKQFPLVVVRANDEIRVGIDPACYSAFATRIAGPEVAAGAMVATSSTLDERQVTFEEMAVRLCEAEEIRFATIAAWLAGVEGLAKGELPPHFERRIVARARDAKLADWVASSPVGEAIRSSLLPVLRFAESDAPSRLVDLEPEADAWAVEAIRRVVFLRLTGDVPNVPGALLLLVAGAVLCGRAQPTAQAFASAYAAWLRAIRFRQFWTAFTPDSQTMAALIRG